jgi:hypothetical protein
LGWGDLDVYLAFSTKKKNRDIAGHFDPSEGVPTVYFHFTYDEEDLKYMKDEIVIDSLNRNIANLESIAVHEITHGLEYKKKFGTTTKHFGNSLQSVARQYIPKVLDKNGKHVEDRDSFEYEFSRFLYIALDIEVNARVAEIGHMVLNTNASVEQIKSKLEQRRIYKLAQELKKSNLKRFAADFDMFSEYTAFLSLKGNKHPELTARFKEYLDQNPSSEDEFVNLLDGESKILFQKIADFYGVSQLVTRISMVYENVIQAFEDDEVDSKNIYHDETSKVIKRVINITDPRTNPIDILDEHFRKVGHDFLTRVGKTLGIAISKKETAQGLPNVNKPKLPNYKFDNENS